MGKDVFNRQLQEYEINETTFYENVLGFDLVDSNVKAIYLNQKLKKFKLSSIKTRAVERI